MQKTCSVLIALLCLGASARASTIFFDGFESPLVESPAGYDEHASGAIGPWTLGMGGVDLIRSYWGAAEGSQSVDLSATSAGSLKTDLATTAGTTYLLMFMMAGNPDGGNVIKQLQVDIGDASQTFTFDTRGHSASNMGWREQFFAFTASGPSTTLTFTSLESDPYGPALDQVSVAPVPEPGTMAIALAGLGAIVGLRRRARRK